MERPGSLAPERFDDRPELLAAEERRPALPRPVLRRLLVVSALCLAVLTGGAPLPRHDGPAPGLAPALRSTDVLAGHPRGSLAGDAAYVDAVRTLSWDDGSSSAGIPMPPVAARSVVFVGDVPGGRWALVAGGAADDLAASWFTGPPGARPDQLTPQPVRRNLAVDMPVTLADPLTGALVVVAAAGDQVTVSARPEISADGSSARHYRPAPVRDGVAVLGLGRSDLAYSAAPFVRVLRHGAILLATHPEVVAATGPSRGLAVHFVRPAPSETGRQVAEAAAVGVLSRLGLRREQVSAEALWVGAVPRAGAVTGLAAIVAVTVPSGAVVIDAEWIVPAASVDYFLGSACGSAIEPAGIPPERRVVAMACDVLFSSDDEPMRTSLVVVGPPEVDLVRVYSSEGALLSEEPATDGVVVAPLPPGTDRVEAVTSAGVHLGRVGLLHSESDFSD